MRDRVWFVLFLVALVLLVCWLVSRSCGQEPGQFPAGPKAQHLGEPRQRVSVHFDRDALIDVKFPPEMATAFRKLGEASDSIKRVADTTQSNALQVSFWGGVQTGFIVAFGLALAVMLFAFWSRRSVP
jgi:hypothetical protein